MIRPAPLSDELVRKAHEQHMTGIKLDVLGRHYGVRAGWLSRRMRTLGLDTYNFNNQRERARVMGWPVEGEFDERSASSGVVGDRLRLGRAGGGSNHDPLPDSWCEPDGQGQGVGEELYPTTAAILRYIIAYKRWHGGPSPSRRQIVEATGRVLSTVHYHLVKLEEAGLIVIDSDDARSIAIPGASWTPPEWFITSGSQEMEELGPRTRAMGEFILQYMVDHVGVSPSYREIMAGVGLCTISGVDHHLMQLELAGLLRRPMRGRARMIVIPGARWEMGDEIDVLQEEEGTAEREVGVLLSQPV